jgi:hypothetical protein
MKNKAESAKIAIKSRVLGAKSEKLDLRKYGVATKLER